MDDRKKKLLAAGVALIALGIARFAVLKGSGSSDGDTQANVAQFAKSIDATKSNSPSVPAERLALGRMGGKGK
ncbi:hypothetical protein BH11ARM2_BH11ARM2_09030 [soil metagenome]